MEKRKRRAWRRCKWKIVLFDAENCFAKKLNDSCCVYMFTLLVHNCKYYTILIIMKWKNTHTQGERVKAYTHTHTHGYMCVQLVNMNKMYKQLRYNKLHSFLLSLFAQCFIMHCILVDVLYSICVLCAFYTIWRQMCALL